MATLVRAKYPESNRPRALSSFEMNKLPPLKERFKLGVVIGDDFENDLMVWSAMRQVIGDRIDPVILARHHQDAAARWGYWHWLPVRLYGEVEEELFMTEADKLLIIGPKSDEMLVYFRDLAKYYGKPVSWASPKEK